MAKMWMSEKIVTKGFANIKTNREKKKIKKLINI